MVVFELEMEESPSGLWRRLGKAVYSQEYRGFKSHLFRHSIKIMENYKSKQQKTISEMEKTFIRGGQKSTIVEMRQDYFNDNQIALTSIIRIDSKICNKITEEVIEPLRQIDPNHFYFSPESMHITIKNIRTINNPPSFTQEDVDKASTLFSKLIPKFDSFEFEIEDVILFPTSISVMAYSNKTLYDLVTALDKGLNEIGVPDNKQYFSNSVFWGNITICRFTEKPSNEFVEKVKSLRYSKFGKQRVDKINLVEMNAVLNPRYLKIVADYKLR